MNLFTCPYCNKMYADHGLARLHIDACPKKPQPAPIEQPTEEETEKAAPGKAKGGKK